MKLFCCTLFCCTRLMLDAASESEEDFQIPVPAVASDSDEDFQIPGPAAADSDEDFQIPPPAAAAGHLVAVPAPVQPMAAPEVFRISSASLYHPAPVVKHGVRLISREVRAICDRLEPLPEDAVSSGVPCLSSIIVGGTGSQRDRFTLCSAKKMSEFCGIAEPNWHQSLCAVSHAYYQALRSTVKLFSSWMLHCTSVRHSSD
eukprot:9487680-Pyramimonas_sp.AAC.1